MTVDQQTELGHKIVDLIWKDASGEPILELMHVLTGVAATMAGAHLETYKDRAMSVRLMTMMLMAFQKELDMPYADIIKLVHLMREHDPANPERN